MKNLHFVVLVLFVVMSALFSSCTLSSKARKADAAAASAAAEKEERERDKIAIGVTELTGINRGLATLNEGMELLLSKFPIKAELGSEGRRSLRDLHGELYDSIRSVSPEKVSPAQTELLGAMEEVRSAERKLDSAWFALQGVLGKYGHPIK